MTLSSTRLVSAALAFVFGLGLLGAALPYTLAFGQVLSAQQEVEAIQAQTDAARPDFSPLIRVWERAVRIYPDPRLRGDLALLRLQQGRLDGAASTALWEALADDYEALLADRPLAPVDWARQAYVLTRAGDLKGARAAMIRSFRTGRYAPGYMQWRYTHALFLMDGMTKSQRDLLGDQTGILLRKKNWDLVRMARLAPFAGPIDSLIRTYHPSRLEEFLRKRGPVKTANLREEVHQNDVP